MHLDPESVRSIVERWEVGLMVLIRDRYRCTPEEAVQIRRRFREWQEEGIWPRRPSEESQMDAVGMPLLLGSDDRPVLSDALLAVLDDCAHPEWAEQAAQLAADALRRSNVDARALATTLASEGLTCPHCHQHTKDIRFVEPSRSGQLYFICRKCGRSFVPVDLEGLVARGPTA
jgi:transposase